jgi:hypothetical protein
MEKEVSLKEKRIRKIAPIYYSRKDVLSEIYEFSKSREVSPRYFDGFGKRPDSFQYPSDITSMVKKGATSFHCSEELWQDPLQLSTDLSQEQLSDLRIGWDLIIDIDCPWIDYSKKAAQAIIKALEHRGVKNSKVKFSGSKGFHIIVPWKAFPKQLNGISTAKMFPDWPRAIINYLKYLSRPILANLIKDFNEELSKKQGLTGIKCENCHNIAIEKFLITLRCPKCSPPYIETFKSTSKDFKEKKCPNCKSILKTQDSKKFFNCPNCNLDSLNSPNNFNEEIIATDIFQILGLDVLLVSSRHLFRMPYSLHEKTGLASVVLSKEELENFDISLANPLNAKVKSFSPNPSENEAEDLLINAIDWQSQQPQKQIDLSSSEKSDFQPVSLPNATPEMFPPQIQKILQGMEDGRKRSLFILLNFFRSLGTPMEKIQEKINKWNSLNKPPLKQGYINSQLIWHSKNKTVLPPNFSNQIYKELGIFESDPLSEKVKNPVNYVVAKSKSKNKNKSRKNKTF